MGTTPGARGSKIGEAAERSEINLDARASRLQPELADIESR
jgi:hypothetical protein